MSNIKQLVESIVDGKGANAKEVFEQVMAEKAAVALEAKKFYVAKKFFGESKE